jgi:CheY-like chemotaxis protein
VGTNLRVLIAEDHYLQREGTRRLLEEVEGVEVVGTAADYEGVLQQARALRPDVVLMDVKMPPTETTEGIRAAHAIKAEQPGVGVLVLTQHDDDSYVWALLEQGVEGYDLGEVLFIYPHGFPLGLTPADGFRGFGWAQILALILIWAGALWYCRPQLAKAPAT